MCQSLLEQDKVAYIYILAIDQLTAQIVRAYNLPNTQIMVLNDFEDSDLLSIKASRTLGEYCWTITPSLILYCLRQYNLPQVCYVDADVYFYHNPAVLLQEAKDKAILLSPHRYSPKYDQSKTSGIYCVQFMNFMNNAEGLEALIWWRQACIEWCYNRIEPNRFGDQKYLDDWPKRFKSVHVLEHLGGGVAPWNVQQYKCIDNHLNHFTMQDNQGDIFNLIFYHFHGVKFFSNGEVDLGGYCLNLIIKNKIYIPYVKKIIEIDKACLENNFFTQDRYLHEICDQENFSFKKKLQRLRNKLNKTDNRVKSWQK